MVLYILLLFFPILCMGVTRDKRQIIRLFFIALLAMLALRSASVGVDLKNYIYYFEKIQIINFASLPYVEIELGYVWLNKLCSLVSNNFHFFVFVVAIICVVPIKNLYEKKIQDPYLTIVLFMCMPVFPMLFSGLRQAIAIAIGCIAYSFVEKRKIIPYLFTIFIAVLFHKSAIILLLMYPLYVYRLKRKHLLMFVPLALFIFVYNEEVFRLVLPILGDRYTEMYGIITNTGAYAMLVLFVIFLIFSLIVVDDKKIDEETRGLINFLGFVIMVQLFAPINNSAMRMSYYYILFIPLLIPKVIYFSKKGMRQITNLARYFMLFFFTVYFIYDMVTGADVLEIYPYVFLWGE